MKSIKVVVFAEALSDGKLMTARATLTTILAVGILFAGPSPARASTGLEVVSWAGQGVEEQAYSIGQDLLDRIPISSWALGSPSFSWNFSTHQEPVSWWRLDEGEGLRARNSMNPEALGVMEQFDSAGWVEGRRGHALAFDGRESYVRVSRLQLPVRDFTYSVWVNLDRNTDETILMASNGAGSNELQLHVGTPDDLTVVVAGFTVAASKASIPVGSWTHLAVTRAGSLVQVYVDGRYEGSGINGDELNFRGCPLLMGVDADSGCTSKLGNFAHGIIDEVKVYDRALSYQEILAEYVGTSELAAD